jgi:hypothetical protein
MTDLRRARIMTMKHLLMFMTALGILAVATAYASAQPSTTFRDSMGRMFLDHARRARSP